MLEIIGKAQAAGVSPEELAALCERKQKRTEVAGGGPALIGGAGFGAGRGAYADREG